MKKEDIEKNKTWTKELFFREPKNGNKVIVGHGGIVTNPWVFQKILINQGCLFIITI